MTIGDAILTLLREELDLVDPRVEVVRDLAAAFRDVQVGVAVATAGEAMAKTQGEIARSLAPLHAMFGTEAPGAPPLPEPCGRDGCDLPSVLTAIDKSGLSTRVCADHAAS